MKAAERAWLEAWERAPESDELLRDEPGKGASKAQMTAECEWLDKTKAVVQAQALGESRESENRRVWVSDLDLHYEINIEPGDFRMTIVDFYDPRIGRE